MAMKYKIDIIAALKEAGYNTSRIRKEKIMGEAMLQKIRSGQMVSWAILETICDLLDCQPGDLIEYVKEAQLYTKEERLQNYKEGVHQDQAEVIATLEADNPLRDAYILSLTDVTKANEVAQAAAKIKGVQEVTNRQDLIKTILSITGAVKHVSIWLLIILAAISVFIISNTIKLGMFSRRKEINIMKFVGATNWFIRWPFIIEGMLLGAVGAALAVVVVMLGYGSFLPTVQEFMGDIRLLDASEVSTVVIIGFLLMG